MMGAPAKLDIFFNRSSSGCKKNDIIFLILTMKKHGFAPKIAFLRVNLNIIWTNLKNNDSLSWHSIAVSGLLRCLWQAVDPQILVGQFIQCLLEQCPPARNVRIPLNQSVIRFFIGFWSDTYDTYDTSGFAHCRILVNCAEVQMGSGIPISTTYPMEGASIQLGFMGLGSPKNDFFPKMEDIPRKMVILVQVIKKNDQIFRLISPVSEKVHDRKSSHRRGNPLLRNLTWL